MTQTRRSFLGSAAALSAVSAVGLPKAAHAADPLGVALITPSPIADVGWSRSLATGLEAVKTQLGDGIKLTFLQNIAEGPDADRIMQKAVSDGNGVIVAGSFGYQNGALQLARRNPDVSVLHASGFKTAPNFSNFAARNYEGTYLMGMAAAALSKTGKLGAVSAFAIPELIASVNAFALGAQAVDPAAELSVIWVNTWFDPAKEQQAAEALISQGVDAMFSNAQDTPSVVAVCEKAGVYVCNLNSSMKAYAPTKYMGVVGTDWEPYFLSEIEAHLAGTFKGASHWLGIADKVIVPGDWSPDIPAEVMVRIEKAQAAIAAGELAPFDGPLLRADGTEAAPAGGSLPDDQIFSMDWQVKGVVTPLPN